MMRTFHPYAYPELKEYVTRLLEEGKSFEVTLVVDVNNQPHHWEVEEK